MTKAQKMKVTVSTIEEQDGEDYTIKVKVSTEKLEGIKPLADSSLDFYAVGRETWLKEHRKRARANAGKGLISNYSHIYYQAVEEEEDAPTGPKTDEEMNLSELRAKYPDIKATSKDAFLEKVKEAAEAAAAKKAAE